MSPSHQISNITVGADGKLYVHVGDGFVANTASNLNDFRGKILRINQDGTAPSDNPFRQGGRDRCQGLRLRLRLPKPLRRSMAAVQRDALRGGERPAEQRPAGGRSQGHQLWLDRHRRREGDANALTTRAIYNWAPTHAPVNIEFVEAGRFGGSKFPTGKRGTPSSPRPGRTTPGPQARGKRIVEFGISATHQRQSGPTPFVEYRGVGRATAVGLAAGPDGLYFTDLYKDLNARTRPLPAPSSGASATPARRRPRRRR